MIQLTVLSYNGQPATGPSATFDELGGTIGRADNNQLVLPDPERTISRVHARVVFRGGGYTIVDNGSNPISVNGQPLGSGREHPLKAGDEVQIGGYLLKATAGAAAAPADPFADLFGGSGLAAPTIPPAPVRSPMASWPPPPPPAAWPPPAQLAPGHIPEDWDPFGADPAAAAPGIAAPPPAGPVAGFGVDVPLTGSGGASIDDLFGLDGGPPRLASDPLALSPVPPSQQRAATEPLRGSELNTPMPLPPSGAVFSWDLPPRDARITQPEPPAAAVVNPGRGQPPSAPVKARPAALPPAEPVRAGPPAAADDALLGALMQGLGIPGLRIDALTPELMQRIGSLLRESTRGAVELLVARAALKREMRAEVTMIVARENNPLKFSPSVEVALQHLLGPPMPGFMAAEPAVRDAFDDLRAHQLGVMAGMKAALDGVLERFDPQQLEGKLTRKSAINALIPATRKARLWELFTELFGQLQTEAQEDFDELFGKAFLKAYQAQLDRLQNER